jgi:hypothetical protein
MSARLYIDDATGSYRVYDTVFTRGRSKPLPLGSTSANYRVFVYECGRRRLYEFPRKEAHGITEPELERQLRYAHSGDVFDASDLTPDPR